MSAILVHTAVRPFDPLLVYAVFDNPTRTASRPCCAPASFALDPSFCQCNASVLDGQFRERGELRGSELACPLAE